MANGDTILLLIRCPEPDCATRQLQTAQLSQAWLEEMLAGGENIRVLGALCGHTWSLTATEKENLRNRFAAQ
jgi:hypothetical protein